MPQRHAETDGPTVPRYTPADASAVPRYSGIKTFARCPQVDDVAGLDVVAVGVPFDTATSFRPGARFGPEAIRAASVMTRPWHPVHEIDVFSVLSVGDWGDLPVTPGNAERTATQIADALAPLVEAGVTPITFGGDHSIVLGELRAYARHHGPVGLVLLDAHADTWDQYYGERYFHGTPFRRALEEGLVDPRRSLLAGMRGPLYAASDLEEPCAWGFETLTCDELRALTPEQYADRVRGRVGQGPVFLSFDIDVIDPGFAPGTGTPEVAGLLPHEALACVRALAGLDFVGFDLVEVAPGYDGPGQTTALLAANMAFEFLALRAVAQRCRDGRAARPGEHP
jgi:agmatinase